jgi:hypothetical protein
MAITTFAELKAAIEDYLVRTNAQLNARTEDFIALFEGRLNRTVRVADMQQVAGMTPAFSGGDNSGAASLPADYLEWTQASWTDGTNIADLRYVEPDSEDWRFRYRPFGLPSMFTIVGSTFFMRPYRTGVITFYYYHAIPPLAPNATNWLLARSPDLYLHGSLMEAYRYLKDEKRAADLLPLVNADMAALIGEKDANKVARRQTQRQAEIAGIAQSRNPMTGAA